MSLYWRDREGNQPPPGALFSCAPFASSLTPLSVSLSADLPPPRRVRVVKRTFLPTREEWMKSVEQALTLIQRKELEKVVFARTCVLELEEAPDPFALTAALQKKAEGAFLFCLETERGAFLGASPERLFRREGRQIITEAVAGTRPRGQTERQELLHSSKDRREFSFIPPYLQNALAPLCTNPLAFSPISVHQTQNVQHLYSRGVGLLRSHATDPEIVEALHPTPALCGLPKAKALSWIGEQEPFERGLYGGVIGWHTPEASEWIVAIRSCLLEGKRATLFSGAGIVEGSDPAAEWEELDQKLKLYDGILDH